MERQFQIGDLVSYWQCPVAIILQRDMATESGQQYWQIWDTHNRRKRIVGDWHLERIK